MTDNHCGFQSPKSVAFNKTKDNTKGRKIRLLIDTESILLK